MTQKSGKEVKNTRFGRGRYNTDYAPDENGEFHYIGSHYMVDLEPKKMRALRIRLIVLSLLALAAFLAGGTSNGVTGRTVYALIPFICCMLPVGYLLMGLCSWLMRREKKLTRKGMDETLNRMRNSAVGMICTAAIALAGGIVACVVHKAFAEEILFLLSAAALMALGILIRLTVRAIPLREIRRGEKE